MKEKIKIGMSSCLLGEEVRWDGDHKYDQYVRDVLGSYFDYVSICPEVDVGNDAIQHRQGKDYYY